MPAICAALVASRRARAARRGRALHGGGHPRRPTPRGDRGGHRRRRRHRAGAAERQRLRHRRPRPRHPRALGRRDRRKHRRLGQRHADPHAHRRRPARRQGLRVRARRRRLPHEAVRARRSSCSASRALDRRRAPPQAAGAGDRRSARSIRSAARSTATAATSRSPASSSPCSRCSSPPKAGSSAPRSSWSGRGIENADPFTNAVRITVSALRKRLGEPWIIATVAGAGYRIDTQQTATVDRGPGLSVRLKLTLSYAGFLMLAGALLLAVVWVFLLRYVPDAWSLVGLPAPRSPTAPTSWPRSPRRRRSCWGSCSCSASSEGGCSPARCSRP